MTHHKTAALNLTRRSFVASIFAAPALTTCTTPVSAEARAQRIEELTAELAALIAAELPSEADRIAVSFSACPNGYPTWHPQGRAHGIHATALHIERIEDERVRGGSYDTEKMLGHWSEVRGWIPEGGA